MDLRRATSKTFGVARHAGVVVEVPQRGGFTGYRLCRRPLIFDVWMSAGLDASMVVNLF